MIETEHDVTNELHRERCAECAEVWAGLERISRAARALPTLSPSRDLWAGIEARLVGSPTAKGGSARDESLPRARRRWFTIPVVRMAAAASLLIAATATLTWQVATRGAAGSRAFPSVTSAPLAGPNGGAGEAALYRQASYESDFGALDREVKALESVVATQPGDLDPATVAILERNLAVIDRALAESREAFLRDPASRFLATQLARSYSSKLTFLRDLAKLPTGI